jgi:CheY-like chemotaxis protein
MVIGGQARRLNKDRARPDLVARAADMIEAAAERGAALTRQLLSFARRQPLSRTTLSLTERIETFREILAKSLGDARLEVALAADLWPVEADANELEVAMINLAVNARDAMPGGGVLTIAAENVLLKAGDIEADLAGEFVALRFADTGVGIPADLLPKVFDPFFTTKQPDKGTGLGLSQVYGFARQVGGTATVESVLGRGTTVVLYLPRARAAEVAKDAAEADPQRRSGVALVVEDNPDVAEITADLVQQLGFKAVLAQSADAALQACESGAVYDLVVTDVVMAGSMDGLALAGALRTRWPTLPIVLVSGYPKSVNAVGDSFPVLSKPFKLEALERAVSAARRAASGEPAASNVVRLDEKRRPPG